MTSNASLTVGTFTVLIGSHQWGFLDGAHYQNRTIGRTPYGTFYRQMYGIKIRHRQVRFAKTDTLIDDMRELARIAGVTGQRVKFIPDVAVPTAFWWVDWPTSTQFVPVLENRTDLTIVLTEQSPGL